MVRNKLNLGKPGTGKPKHVVILTGAGISAESGVPTFRASDGLWEGHRIEDVATPAAFARNPALVQDFYNQRRRHLATVQPNAAHLALARLERAFAGSVLVVTQNVDDLHARAGTQNLIHMHGQLLKMQCTACAGVFDCVHDIATDATCGSCASVGTLRPDIVWFGEMPYQMERINAALQACDLFVSIGTSGQVYPAAGFVQTARYFKRAQTLELNLDPTHTSPLFHDSRGGRAGALVPAWVDEVLG
jgi:NAD-dependent deacetylase